METANKQEKPAAISYSNIISKKIRVIGIPLDLGQSRRGVDMGPSAVRVAGLEARLEALGHVVEDGGNVAVAIPEQKKEGSPREISEGNHCNLYKACRAGTQDPGSRQGSRCIRWRSLGSRRHSCGSRGILSSPESKNRIDLDRCSCRHQHAR